MRGLLGTAVAAAVVATAGAGAVEARSPIGTTGAEFALCDGYGVPSKSADGMTKRAVNWGNWGGAPDGDASRDTVVFGDAGARSCDVALSNPWLTAEHWPRRVSLLRAKAVHQIAAGAPQDALLTLDLAEAAAARPEDIFYRRSLGLGIQMIRAFALDSLGRGADAEALAMQTWRLRPFSRGATGAALMVLGDGGAPQNRADLSLRLAQLSPVAASFAFDELFRQRRWAEATSVFPFLQPPVTLPEYYASGTSAAYYNVLNRSAADRFGIKYGLRTAYAEAAQGRRKEALSMIEQVRAKAEEAGRPPLDIETLPKALRQAARDRLRAERSDAVSPLDRKLRKDIADNAPKLIDQWERMAEARLLLVEGKTAEAAALTSALDLPLDHASLDLLEAMAASAAADRWRREADAMRSRLSARPAPASRKAELTALYEALPEAETRETSITYDAKLSSWADVKDGAAKDEAGYGYIWLRRGQGTLGMMEEVNLLKAAEFARNKGLPVFVIRQRNETRYFEVQTYAQAAETGTPMWMSSAMEIEPVDPKHTPQGRTAQPAWRQVPVSEVYAALAPIYGEASAREWPR